jgi:hypothetical protein
LKLLILYIILSATVCTADIWGQVTIYNKAASYREATVYDTTSILGNLFQQLVSSFDDGERIRINESITTILDSYVRSDSVFRHTFKKLRYLGQITSPDSIVKIVTWNLVLESGQSRYYSYIIRKTGGKENRIYNLTTSYNENTIFSDTTYNERNWYGGLYYDLRPYIIGNERVWVMLGIDYGNPFVTRKIIDVLSFTSDGSIVFGRKWFFSGDNLKFREVFEYAPNSKMSLRFNSDNRIVFDHLVPFSPDLKDDRQYYGPDYSFDAYDFIDGIWKLIINADVRNKE